MLSWSWRRSERDELGQHRGVARRAIGRGDPRGRRVEPRGVDERGGQPALRQHSEGALGDAAAGARLPRAQARHLLEQRRERQLGRRSSLLASTPEAASAAQLVEVLEDACEGVGARVLRWRSHPGWGGRG